MRGKWVRPVAGNLFHFLCQIQTSIKLTAAASWSSLSSSIHMRSVARMTSRLRHSPRHNSSRGGDGGGGGGVTGCKSNSFSQGSRLPPTQTGSVILAEVRGLCRSYLTLGKTSLICNGLESNHQLRHRDLAVTVAWFGSFKTHKHTFKQ